MSLRMPAGVVLFLLLSVNLQAQQADAIDVDILLKGGTLLDGTGGPAVTGDLGIKDDHIVAVGEFSVGEAQVTIDCRGLIITPGFIDLHNHSDRGIVRSETRAAMNYLTQGCTTIVTGNCGSGPINVGKYYDQIDESGAGPNVAHLFPQGSLRSNVIGSTSRAATDDEMARMRELTEKAMQDGAWGMATGLIYVPGTYTSTEELVELAKIVASHQGIYASHIRNESTKLLDAVHEAMTIGRQAGLPVHVSHFKCSGQDAWGLVRQAADLIQQARDAGQVVTADQYPYIASSTSLEATVIPTWARDGGHKQLIRRFDDPETGERLRKAIAASLSKKRDGAAVRIARFSERRDWVGRDLADIAQGEGKTPLEIVEIITRAGGAAIVNFSMNEDDVRHVMQRPWVATASDGSAKLPSSERPHPRNYGTFSRKLGYYALREGVLPIEQAVRSSTGLPADIIGFTDRGYLKPGQFADVVVFDPKELIDLATFDDPHQYSAGIRYVYVNGVPAISEGNPTGALAGKALRHGTGGSAVRP